ncbi:type II toxin-antitoxin system RelB family antitoxin [Desulfonauticus submarinus]
MKKTYPSWENRKTITVSLPVEDFERLDKLAKHTGRSKNFYIKEALSKYLDEVEDIYFLERSIELVRTGQDELIDLEEAEEELCSE